MPERYIQAICTRERVWQVQEHKAFFRAAPTSARDCSINNIRTNRLIKLTVLLGDVKLQALLDLGA